MSCSKLSKNNHYLTNLEPKNKKEKVYNKLILNQDGIIVKLADRIANVEFSLIHNNPNKLKTYKEEQKDLKEKIYPKINTELGKKLAKYLDNLFKDIN